MRSMLTATIVLVAAGASVAAQPSATLSSGGKPKQVATAPIRPPVQAPSDTANAMAPTERQAIQSDLAWVGQYNGAITGDVSERMIAAIKEFQQSRGGKATGVLNPQEREVLAETARRRQDGVGWKLVTDAGSGARLGLPTKLVPRQASDANGSKWSSPTGTVQILLSRRKEAGSTTAKLAELEKRDPPGRATDYTVVKPEFFVLSGLQGLKKFYVRGHYNGDEVRTLTILYDQATENTVEPVVIAMSSAFNPFPAGAPPVGAAPRKYVEYGTGVVVSDDGAIIADRRLTDDCLTIAIAGHGPADRLAEDKDHDLALLRIYGARALTSLALSQSEPRSRVELTGIADPQNQGGGAAASSVTSSIMPLGDSHELGLVPAPALGFSGAAALDDNGRLSGIALLKQVAGTAAANPTPVTQATLVPAEAVRQFLTASGVGAAERSSDAKASLTNNGMTNTGLAKAAVVRVICVRK